MIQIVKQPEQFSFSGNPIRFDLQCDSLAEIIVALNVAGRVFNYSVLPFGTTAPYSASVDVSTELKSYFSAFSVPEDQLFAIIENFKLEYKVIFTQGSASILTFTGYAINGGVNSIITEQLKDKSLDMFSYRLRNVSHNFLFTTRTNSRHIFIRETELYPFLFISSGDPIFLASPTMDILTIPPVPEGEICSINFDYIRQLFFDLFSELPSSLTVYPSRDYAFDMTFFPNRISEDRYRIRFRNSFGAYEIIELTGVANKGIEFADAYGYNVLVDRSFYEKRRDRLTAKESISEETGYKSQQELAFVQDMIMSDETYFIYPDGRTMKCNVTAEKYNLPLNQRVPTSIALKVEFVTEDKYYTPNLNFDDPDVADMVVYILTSEDGFAIATEDSYLIEI